MSKKASKKKATRKKAAKKAAAKLTAKQQRFVDEYLIDLNATQAAIRTGYSAKTAGAMGHELLKKPEIAAAIKKAMDERAARTQIDQDYVTSLVVETIDNCRQARPVLDRKGQHVMVETPGGEVCAAFVFDAANVLRGADMLAKHTGYYEADNKQRGGEVAELLKEIAGSAGVLDKARERSSS